MIQARDTFVAHVTEEILVNVSSTVPLVELQKRIFTASRGPTDPPIDVTQMHCTIAKDLSNVAAAQRIQLGALERAAYEKWHTGIRQSKKFYERSVATKLDEGATVAQGSEVNNTHTLTTNNKTAD